MFSATESMFLVFFFFWHGLHGCSDPKMEIQIKKPRHRCLKYIAQDCACYKVVGKQQVWIVNKRLLF